MPITSDTSTRSASSSSSCPVSSPSSTTIVLRSTAADCTRSTKFGITTALFSRGLSSRLYVSSSQNRRRFRWPRRPFSSATCAKPRSRSKGAPRCGSRTPMRGAVRSRPISATAVPASSPAVLSLVGAVGRSRRRRTQPGRHKTARPRSRLGGVPLTLLAGPANAGKVALLLDRYAADIAREPVLVVPNRPEAQRVQRDLLAGGKAVVGGCGGDVRRPVHRPSAQQRRPSRGAHWYASEGCC